MDVASMMMLILRIRFRMTMIVMKTRALLGLINYVIVVVVIRKRDEVEESVS